MRAPFFCTQRKRVSLQAAHVYAAIDARMGQIYWGCYQLIAENKSAQLMRLVGEEVVIEPGALMLPEGIDIAEQWIGCGTGWLFVNEIQSAGVQVKQVYDSLLPHSLDVLTLALPQFDAGNGLSPEEALPHYVRNNVAKKKSEQGAK